MKLRKTLHLVGLIVAGNEVASAQAVLTLQQVLQQVRTHNAALRIERLNIAAAQADQVTANLRPNPLLNNQTLFQLVPAQVPGTSVDQIPDALSRQRRQFWLQATKEFDVFHKRAFRNQLAQANTNLAAREAAELERSVLFEAANQYLDAWYAHVQLGLLQQAKANADTLVELNRVRLRNLVITSTDLVRTQLLADGYAIQLRTARQELRNRLRELRLMIGSADSVEVAMTDSIVTTRVNRLAADGSPDSLVQRATTRRTDMLSAEATLETTQRNVALQQVLAHPRNEAGLIWNPQNTVPYAGWYVTLELPLYTRNQGGIQKAKVLQEQADLVAASLRKRIRSEVELADQTLGVTRQNVKQYTTIRFDADQVLASVQYAYLRGATTLLDLLQAQRSWFDTQTGYYQAVYAYRQAYIRLLSVSGAINTY